MDHVDLSNVYGDEIVLLAFIIKPVVEDNCSLGMEVAGIARII